MRGMTENQYEQVIADILETVGNWELRLGTATHSERTAIDDYREIIIYGDDLFDDVVACSLAELGSECYKIVQKARGADDN